MINLKGVMETRYTLEDWAGYWLVMLVVHIRNVSLQFSDTSEAYPKLIFLPTTVQTVVAWCFITEVKLLHPSDCGRISAIF